MTTKTNYEFDVAFSFTQQDETLAYQINDLIQDRCKTFIYSEQQKKLAGADGEKKFNEVFSEQARLVVILFRSDWGLTPWTRIEETAIRNRGHEEGYDFTTFVQLDKAAQMPKWLPKNRIYYNFDRWGIKGLAPVIEARIEEAGGQSKSESIEDRSERLKRQRHAEKAREQFLQSHDAINAANQEMRLLIDKFKKLKPLIEDPTSHLHLGHSERPNPPMYELGTDGYYLCFYNSSPFNIGIVDNTLVNTGTLKVTLYEKHGHYQINYSENVLKQVVLRFDRDLLGNNGWSDYDTGKNFMTTETLLDKWVKLFLDGIGKRNINGRR
ncbi:MAG TPA: hypothetical protein PK210_09255 [Bacteroidia bacterium]|nr:hypothetical protein [Bacteroidia bacterium]